MLLERELAPKKKRHLQLSQTHHVFPKPDTKITDIFYVEETLNFLQHEKQSLFLCLSQDFPGTRFFWSGLGRALCGDFPYFADIF